MRSVLTSACLIGCLLASTTAFAAPYSVTVAYKAGDLTTEAGVAAIYEKIAVAAKTVCRPETLMPLSQAIAFQAECAKQTVTDTVAKVDAPALSAYSEAVLNPSRNAATRSETLASR